MAKIVIFSGAGISAESGIKTFREADGTWETYNVDDVCVKGCLEKNRNMVLDFYDKRRCELKNAEPNYAHIQIAKLKEKYPNEIAVITQNVDNLFERAGCKDVIHLHGFITSIRCMRGSCGFKEDIGYQAQDRDRRCPKCNKTLRPDVVFFLEKAPMYKRFYDELKDCEIIAVIGTSGNVIDVSPLLKLKMKTRILNNLEASDLIDDRLFTKVLYKPATKAIDEIVSEIEGFLK